MSKFIDLTGMRFGSLKAIEYQENRKWLCLCDCGNYAIVFRENLKSLHTQSCGCMRVKMMTTHGKYKTRLYTIYNSMKSRCYQSNAKEYDNYGGRGIFICDEWLHSFQEFYDWAMKNNYADNLTIDRIDNDKGYSPSNCRWITKLEQSHNTGMFRSNASGVKGVYWERQRGKWRVRITASRKNIHIGLYDNLEDALIARKEAELKYWGSKRDII